MGTLLTTLEHGTCTADIYEMDLPGTFSIVYRNATGDVLQEEPLSGVSTYKQRETEIFARLQELCEGGEPPSAGLADSGEY